MKRFPVLLAALGVWAGTKAAAAESEPTTASIHNKTLVACVMLEKLEQRDGSALIIIDEQERFDAIVFGERAAGKWMAGSDFFRRTPADQQAYPPETADKHTVVQVAVYVDDVVIECFNLPGRATGRIGLIGHHADRPVEDLRTWHCRLPE